MPDEHFNHIIADVAYKGKSISDVQLYKQAGNAVAVNAVKAIGDRIVKLEYRW